jgi:hypothetical protein
MSTGQLEPYHVTACNTALASENRIHDDAVARRFGFAGGLVPGVEVYAYMTHMALRRWGRDWLTRGSIECRFHKPLYDGETAVVTAVENEGALHIAVEQQGGQRASARAWFACEPLVPPQLTEFILALPPATRPPASESALAPGVWLGITPFRVTTEYAAQYLYDVRETELLLREREPCPSGHRSSDVQLGVGAECDPRAVDSCRKQGPQPYGGTRRG